MRKEAKERHEPLVVAGGSRMLDESRPIEVDPIRWRRVITIRIAVLNPKQDSLTGGIDCQHVVDFVNGKMHCLNLCLMHGHTIVTNAKDTALFHDALRIKLPADPAFDNHGVGLPVRPPMPSGQ